MSTDNSGSIDRSEVPPHSCTNLQKKPHILKEAYYDRRNQETY